VTNKPPTLHDMVQSTTINDLFIGMLLYALRLNQPTRDKIENILAESLPCDFDPERAISMPMTARSDCGSNDSGGNKEVCLTLANYMEVAELIRSQDPRVRGKEGTKPLECKTTM